MPLEADNFIADYVIPLTEDICMKAIGDRDGYTMNHCIRVQVLSCKLYLQYYKSLSEKEKLQFRDNSKKYITYPQNFETWDENKKDKFIVTYLGTTSLSRAATLHDIGKLSWGDILLKGSFPISDDDKNHQLQHPEKGAAKMHDYLLNHTAFDYPVAWEIWILIMIFHHWDYNCNTGYPKPSKIENPYIKKLADRYSAALEKKTNGEKDLEPIRVMIGIIRLCDSIDAMTSNRNYKKKTIPCETVDFDTWEKNVWYPMCDKLFGDNNIELYHPDVFAVLMNDKDALSAFFYCTKRDNPDNSNAEIACRHCQKLL